MERDGFDVIGDIHGQADKLEVLLHRLGYETVAGVWRHPVRRVIFVGDLIDRGPRQLDTVALVRSMVEAGSARVVAGNHEFNAVAFHTPHPSGKGHLRPRDEKRHQHEAFLTEVGEDSADHAELVTWFQTLPLWLEFDGLRVVHACWDPVNIAVLDAMTDETNTLDLDLVTAASEPGSAAHAAIEHVLKGPEVDIPTPYLDKDGKTRDSARFAWWAEDADTFDRGALIPGDALTPDRQPHPGLPSDPIVDPPVSPYRDDVPVFYGHYWETGTPRPKGPTTICVDYSAGKGGPLIAYRWSPGDEISSAHFVSSDD